MFNMWGGEGGYHHPPMILGTIYLMTEEILFHRKLIHQCKAAVILTEVREGGGVVIGDLDLLLCPFMQTLLSLYYQAAQQQLAKSGVFVRTDLF